MISKTLLQDLAKEHGTPLFIIDHDQLRRNLAEFNRWLPQVQPYFAVKANSNPEIVKTLYQAGASFDVASMPEFQLVHDNIKDLPDQERQDYIWDKIIYSHPIKANETLRALDQYKPLVTYDNFEEIKKVKKHAPNVGMLLRLKVPNTGAMVELSSKFGCDPGEAVDLIEAAEHDGITVEGLSFHVGSQTTNFQNYVQALAMAAEIFHEARLRGFTKMNQLDIGGGFPAPYDENVKPLKDLAHILTTEIKRLFPKDVAILAEPGRFLVATAVPGGRRRGSGKGAGCSLGPGKSAGPSLRLPRFSVVGFEMPPDFLHLKLPTCLAGTEHSVKANPIHHPVDPKDTIQYSCIDWRTPWISAPTLGLPFIAN